MTRDPLQRPQHFVPGLRAAPWWDPDELPIVDELERRFPDILEEFHDFVFAGSLMLHPQSAGGPRKQLTTGDWNIVDLWSNGSLNPRNAIRAPVTAALLAADDDVVTGESTLAYFSVVAPHSHVEPHCGPTNARIRIHLGIRTPEGGRIRVGRETRSWQEGRCLVFDDSFEHEVWNDADVPRSVLLVDVAHPDLPRRRRRATAARNGADSIREGWARDGARHTPESELASLAAAEFRSVFALVGPDRAAAVQSAVAKVDDEIPLLRAAASCLEARAVSGRAYARPWAVLSEAADHGAFDHLEDAELADVIRACLVAWRSVPANAAAARLSVARWRPEQTASVVRRLTALGLPSMCEFLAAFERQQGAPPFGATAPVLLAAQRERARAHAAT